ncbi:Palmitoyltransferase zdhhc21 [Ameca splendens]|uniref:Palmitoyltransferase n=1 Tax=Ameca splendens TaxID=208324 RepID=A0ABV0YQS1_9TELE
MKVTRSRPAHRGSDEEEAAASLHALTSTALIKKKKSLPETGDQLMDSDSHAGSEDPVTWSISSDEASTSLCSGSHGLALHQLGHIPWALVVCYYIASALCVVALFRASTADPGRLPVDPHIPHSEREHWELCNKCNLMRPKRSHHCSRCGHCVRRMDHHCPWINNCVGEDNHWLFLQLCFYAQVLSLFTLVLDFCQYYYFQPLRRLDQERFTTRHELALLRVSALMGVVMFGGMSSLFYTQMNGIFSVSSLTVTDNLTDIKPLLL